MTGCLSILVAFSLSHQYDLSSLVAEKYLINLRKWKSLPPPPTKLNINDGACVLPAQKIFNFHVEEDKGSWLKFMSLEMEHQKEWQAL